MREFDKNTQSCHEKDDDPISINETLEAIAMEKYPSDKSNSKADHSGEENANAHQDPKPKLRRRPKGGRSYPI